MSYALAVIAAVTCAGRLPAVEVKCWQPAEVTFHAAEHYANPYLDVTVTVRIKAPDGRRMSIEAFWDGRDVWRLRFTPTMPGRWLYSTRCQPPGDPGLDRQRGVIIAKPNPGCHGFVRVSRRYRHHFEYADGTPFYWAGCNYGNLSGDGWEKRPFPADRVRIFLRERRRQGYSLLWMMNWVLNKPLFRQRKQANEYGPPFVDYDLRRLNPTYFRGVDKRVQFALREGLRPTFALGWPDQGILDYPVELLERAWRYVIARYAAYDTQWILFGEFEEAGRGAVELARRFGRLTRACDPYRHPLTTHTVDSNDELAAEDWLDYIVHQSRDPGLVERDWKFNKPVVNSEWYYENRRFPKPVAHIISDMDEFRRKAWDIRMRGAYLVYEVWSKPEDFPAGLHSKGAVYMAALNQFFRRRKFWLMQPDRAVAGGLPALVVPGEEIIVYCQRGGQARVRVADPRRWRTRLYDTRTGQFVSTGRVQPMDSGLTLRCPDTRDWVWDLVRR